MSFINKIIIFLLLIPIMSFAQEAPEEGGPTIGGNKVYRVGEFKLVAFVDRANEVAPSILKYKNGAVPAAWLSEDYSRDGGLNYFLLDTGQLKILFDAGLSAEQGGQLIASLRAAGYSPADINVICLTHMHGDHIGGLIDANKKAVFTNVMSVYVAEEEAAYWATRSEQAQAVFAAYGSKIKRFQQRSGILPGVATVPAFGHTPGHTMYQITDSGKSFMIVGDLMHAYIQFAHPDVYVTYDTDPELAVQTRKRVFDMLADEMLGFGGMHIVAPGAGTVEKNEEAGGYLFKTHN